VELELQLFGSHLDIHVSPSLSLDIDWTRQRDYTLLSASGMCSPGITYVILELKTFSKDLSDTLTPDDHIRLLAAAIAVASDVFRASCVSLRPARAWATQFRIDLRTAVWGLANVLTNLYTIHPNPPAGYLQSAELGIARLVLLLALHGAQSLSVAEVVLLRAGEAKGHKEGMRELLESKAREITSPELITRYIQTSASLTLKPDLHPNPNNTFNPDPILKPTPFPDPSNSTLISDFDRLCPQPDEEKTGSEAKSYRGAFSFCEKLLPLALVEVDCYGKGPEALVSTGDLRVCVETRDDLRADYPPLEGKALDNANVLSSALKKLR